MTPLWEILLSSAQPSNYVVSVLEGHFELTWRPSGALCSPRALLLEQQRNKETVKCAEQGTEVPGYGQKNN